MDQATAQERVGWDESKRYVLFPYYLGRAVKDLDRVRWATTDAAGCIDEDVALYVVTDKRFEPILVYMNGVDALAFASKREGPEHGEKCSRLQLLSRLD